MKKALTSVVENTFHLINMQAGGGPDEAALLMDMRYIYPWTEEV